jgi:aminopeptidase N
MAPSVLLRARLVPLIAGAFLLASCQSTPGQDSGGLLPPPQRAYEVTHYDLSVQVDPSEQRLEGTVTMHAAATDTLDQVVLNLDRRLQVVRAGRPGGASLPVDRRADGNEVWIDWPATMRPGDSLRVTVAYEGEPRTAPNPPWDGGLTWATTPSGAPWIAVSCQTIGADVWWPVKDDPAAEPDSMDLAFTVPDSLVAAANGALRRVERASDSTRTYHWHVSTPINPYNVTLNAAPYVRIDTTHASTSGAEVPATFYTLPSDSARAHEAFPGFLEQVRFLEQTLGPYPARADKYGVAQAPFLGMEHQSLIAYGHDFSGGGLGYEVPFDALHFHELAHEWYGNLVTAADWKDFWLHEGPATYLEALYAEARRGDSAYHAVTDHVRSQVQGGVAIAHRETRTAQAMYHRDVYFRGAMTLHTLRYVVGAAAVRTILRRFVDPEGTAQAEGPPFRHVTTQDFIETAETVTGRSLDAFFEVYLYRAPLPALKTERSEGRLSLRWTGTGDVTFEVPVPVRVNGTTRRVAMAGGRGQIAVPSGAAVAVDPKGWVLRR